ncbi:uncharacterized protein LOC123498704 isoform X2 [Portunus trituberculatus]|uniref:uncharacterized protein LOC123498704 isoform X2 n=1 Tax=Portunus trituberculatus TaxID=210409 RepID=UPI001E1CDC2C|nr:uncharacterized protein LOC123498704 isoform X2 [Portunus trituberculatus]
MKSLLSLLLATVATQASEDESYVYKTHVCSEENYQGVCHEFHDAVPSLSNYDLDNTISSFKATGVWNFYDEPDYESAKLTTIGINIKTKLLTGELNNKISSLRYAGSQTKFNEAGYNLYEGLLFTKKDFYGTIDIPDLSQYLQRVESIIIIGQSYWTFCEEANYSGRCVCLKAKHHDWNLQKRLDTGLYGFILSEGIYNVTSVKKGCT